MCGIAGVWDPHHKSPKHKEYVGKMANELVHRGPDGRGLHHNQDAGLSMAHTRLAIIDLNTGEQPIVDEKNQTVICANAEFYEYKKLRGNLTAEGYHFSTKSDCEVALQLYNRYGLEFTNFLRGEFAFAIYDGKKDRLILVRDRFGIRPLFYHIKDSQVFYASELKAILAHPGVPRKISDKALIHQMMQVMVPGMTLFEDIHALKPGHMMIIKKTGNGLDVKDRQYWDAEFPMNGLHMEASDEQYIDTVRDKLIESVSLRLEADVPVACYLSGGIDSCSILGMASSIQQSSVKAFTISFDDDRYDESHIAVEMAKKCDADHDILKLSAEQLYGKNFEKALWHSERTFYNTLGVAKMLMSEHVTKSGYKVVITGEGSDEIFGGYAAFKRDMFLHGGLANGMAMDSKLKASNQIFSGSVLAEKEVSHQAMNDAVGFTPSWIQPWLLTLDKAKEVLSDRFLDLLSSYDPVEAIAESFETKKLQGRHALDKAQYTWIKTMLEGQILNWGGDRVDMANSLESRPAFLDHHVVEMAMALPPQVRIRDGIEKWVLREAMKHILPESLYKREKFAFMAPPAHTDTKKDAAFRNLLDKHLHSKKIEQLRLVTLEKFDRFYDGYRSAGSHSDKTRYDIVLNHLIGVHSLASTFIHI